MECGEHSANEYCLLILNDLIRKHVLVHFFVKNNKEASTIWTLVADPE